MATHHHCHCLPTPSTTTCHCTLCSTTTYHHPPPPPLLHSISSHHHHQHHHNPPQIHQYPPPQSHPTQHYNYYPPQHDQQPPPPLNPTVSSLIHRISALETTLRHRKQSPTSSSSLRNTAARTIQTHFRAFLVRRSITLRQLKDLAYIKSSLNHLKSSVSNKTHFDPITLSRETMNLLIKLDSIQGFDPMIRDGKRSISRELIRFMELIDEMCVESEVIRVKNVRFGQNSKKSMDSVSRVFGLKNQRKCAGQIRIGELTKSQGKSQQKVKKNVKFDEDGNVYRLFKSSNNQVLSGGSSNVGDDEEEVEVEEIGVCSKEPEVEEDESSEMSENEMDQRKNLSARIHQLSKKIQRDQDAGDNGEDDDNDDDDDDEDDSFVFSAPLPAKMEY
ncbi:hypothetical protein QVD17_18643 [Tagetes erecta]|uniref:BAG domain-containing protein n=1 Tax=Tagetes erecta TaxID=13708 RepID=A0AAD8KI69_TARER|nr:hypothetical protein QVD17_18643 [Tagetes erecta]